VVPRDEAELLDWTHREHLPAVRSGNGVSWVGHYKIVGPSAGHAATRHRRIVDTTPIPGLPTGKQYLMMVAATSPWIFFQHDAFWRPENSADADGRMLAKRAEARMSIFIDEER